MIGFRKKWKMNCEGENLITNITLFADLLRSRCRDFYCWLFPRNCWGPAIWRRKYLWVSKVFPDLSLPVNWSWLLHFTEMLNDKLPKNCCNLLSALQPCLVPVWTDSLVRQSDRSQQSLIWFASGDQAGLSWASRRHLTQFPTVSWDLMQRWLSCIGPKIFTPFFLKKTPKNLSFGI